MASATSTKVKLMLEIPEVLYDKYAERAAKFNRKPESEILARLQQCQDYISTKPLYFTDDDRAEMEKAFAHNLSDPGDLIAKVKSLFRLKVGDVEVPLSARIQARLPNRVFRGSTLEKLITKVVTEALEVECGMRPR